MKHTEVKSGQYQGKTAIILGDDRTHLGHSIFAERTPLGFDYMKRWGVEHFPITSKVWICSIDGQEVALSEANFKKAKTNEQKSGNGNKGTTGSKSNSSSTD